MYQTIQAHPSTRVLYEKKLVADHLISHDEIKALREKNKNFFLNAFTSLKKIDEIFTPSQKEMPSFTCSPTGVSLESLLEIDRSIVEFPAHFQLHPLLNTLLFHKEELLEKSNIDWSTAEALPWEAFYLKVHMSA